MLSKILDREFRRLATARGDAGLLQLKRQAEVVGLSPSYWGRLRRGKAPLPSPLATTIARFLHEDDPQAQHRLVEELLAAASADDDLKPSSNTLFINQVRSFFDELHSPDCLLCIEYRDFPRADQSARYPELAISAGDAVAAGLSLAMFQPFGASPAYSDTWPPHADLLFYLNTLRMRVRNVYAQMDSAARKAATAKSGPRGGIVLYEHADEWKAAFGIQSRLFYVETRRNNRPEYATWEWVAGEENDYFVKRDPESIDRPAIAAQFEPVISYWRDRRSLPASSADMVESVKSYAKYRADFLPSQAKQLKSPWIPYGKQ